MEGAYLIHYETICSIKGKLKEQDGIPSDLHLGLMYNGKLLDDGRILGHCNILEKSTLHLFLSQHTLVKTLTLYVMTWSGKNFYLNVKSVDTIDDVKAKLEENEGIACNKVKELEATISGLTHKNKVFSAQCATYESQLVALEAEYKKTKEQLMVADKKYYSGARAAGYAEGLKEGKTKWLKSMEFLHHLTDASMQYFNYGFDSCQKQAEQQGFVGQLNKDSALKDAPELKGWESSNQPE